jgi:hypothetical protein
VHATLVLTLLRTCVQHAGERDSESDPVDDDERRLKVVLGELMSLPLDRSKPLWVVYDIRGFADGSSVLFVKIHVPLCPSCH